MVEVVVRGLGRGGVGGGVGYGERERAVGGVGRSVMVLVKVKGGWWVVGLRREKGRVGVLR